MKKALITGITGQGGSYLAEFLLEKGYEVHGLIRRSSTFNTERIDHIYADPHDLKAKLFLHYGDITDSGQLTNLIYNIQPDEIYHLAAQSHIRVSFDMPEFTGDVTGIGTTRLLESIRRSGIKTRFYQASSSKMFGDAPPPHNEETPFRRRSPYGAAKVYAYWMVRNCREGYGMFAVNGILFNHESPRRGETFVTRKITRALARIKIGLQDKLYLGNLEAKRDWMISHGALRISVSFYCLTDHSIPFNSVTGYTPLENVFKSRSGSIPLALGNPCISLYFLRRSMSTFTNPSLPNNA